MIVAETDEIINELFESLLTSFQDALANKMKDCDFAFDYVDGWSYLCHKISLNRDGSYIDSSN